jgi:hypothetical protein
MEFLFIEWEFLTGLFCKKALERKSLLVFETRDWKFLSAGRQCVTEMTHHAMLGKDQLCLK